MKPEEVEIQRISKNKFYKENEHSPLTPSQKKRFEHLEYYPYNAELAYLLELNKYDDPEVVTMETSDNRVRDYYRIGYLDFEVNGEKARLHVYQDTENSDYYFIPFRDSTSGKETYGAGRYVELERARDGKFSLDFNLAYNPYCAYNSLYSCPIPLAENTLSVAITAGEKKYPDAEY